MLEWASTCFESGSRQLLRAPKPCLRTRRALHSHVWHDGASDRVLPGWRAASSTGDGGSGDGDNRAARAASSTQPTPHRGAMLEFLYPKKTLALMQRLSLSALDTSVPPRRQLHRPPIRRFSTAQRQPALDESGVDPAAVQQAKEEAASMLAGNEPRSVLARFLRHREPGKQELAWQLYSAVPASRMMLMEGATLSVQLLEYLTTNDETLVPSRVLQIFAALPREHRRGSSYRAATVAYISLRMVGPALQQLEAVRPGRSFDVEYGGVDLVLRRTILDEQWDLALRLFSLMLRQTPGLGPFKVANMMRHNQPLPQVWRVAAALPGLEDHFESFLVYVREFQHELRSSEEKAGALSLFASGFVPNVIDQIVRNHNLNEAELAKTIRRLFKHLRALGLATPAAYHHAIRTLLELLQDRSADDIATLCKSLYSECRLLWTEGGDSKIRATPSPGLLRKMMFLHCESDDLVQAENVVKDFRTWHPTQPMPAKALMRLLTAFADYGDTVNVNKFFEELRSHFPDEVGLNQISSLLFASARRADVDGTVAQFNRIRGEFGLTPDVTCWNILLLAYVRAEDLEGAIGCFNACMDSGNSPDKHTFGTLLDLCSARGDVEAFEALFSRAKQMGIPMSQDARARSGYVQVFLNAGDVEGAEAIARDMLISWRTGTLSGHSVTYTWNSLILHYALIGDIASARQRYKEMVNNNIPLDTWTYGSLMRALIEVKQSNAAYKILTKTMPQNNVRVRALHYAIVMTGLLREGGGQLDLAMEAYNNMVKQGIMQTVTSQAASIRILGAWEMNKLNGKSKNARLQRAEQAVQKMVVDAVQGQLAHRQPRHSRSLDPKSVDTNPQVYYGLLVSLYAQRGAYSRCKALIEQAEKAVGDSDHYIVPLTLLTGTMEAHLKAGEHAEVAKCWKLARASASKFSKTFHQVMKPSPPTPDFNSLLDPAVRESYEKSRISLNRRHILHKAARLYMRSLLDPKNPDLNALDNAQRTMRNLLVNGYTLDVYTWNEMVTALAERDRLTTAFSICEEYLMPSFPGWRNLDPNYVRKDRQGHQWMELRHYEIKKTSIIPKYKTLIKLATEFRKVKSDERSGVGYDVNAGAWRSEILEKTAPMTLRAIETMPRTNDWLQTKYFQNT